MDGNLPLGPRLLIVDDVAENREFLRRRFERRGFKVIEADGGLSALQMIAEQPVDTVLLDIQMPDLNGLEVLRRIRQDRSAVELPVIMVTAQTQHADVQAAVEAEANAFVAKPVDFELMLSRVEAQLNKRADALSESGAPLFFTFADIAHSVPPYPIMGLADEALVTAYLSVEQLMAKLGGCARYVDPKGRVYLGVWGAKNVEGLHTLLSSRVPRLVVKRDRPPGARLEWRRTAAAA